MHYPRRVKENGQHHFDVAMHLSCLFSHRDVECLHCDDYILVSRSYALTHDSSPVMTEFRKLGSPFMESNMSCETSRQSSFCSIVSNVGMNFTVTLRRPKSSFEIECTELEHTPTSAVGFFNGAATVLHKKSPHLVNHLVISAS